MPLHRISTAIFTPIYCAGYAMQILSRLHWNKLLPFLSVAIAACLTAAAAAVAGSPQRRVIPLPEIWATSMPGTRDLHKLGPKKTNSSSLADQIGAKLDFIPSGQVVSEGFAVAGTGKEALNNAYKVLVIGQKPTATFRAADDISLVFFSHLFSQYVHVRSVEIRDRKVTISYRLVPHRTKEVSAHFALIPIGKLSAGEYKVDIVRLPLEQKYVAQGLKPVDAQWDDRIVCKPFSFKVK